MRSFTASLVKISTNDLCHYIILLGYMLEVTMIYIRVILCNIYISYLGSNNIISRDCFLCIPSQRVNIWATLYGMVICSIQVGWESVVGLLPYRIITYQFIIILAAAGILH